MDIYVKVDTIEFWKTLRGATYNKKRPDLIVFNKHEYFIRDETEREKLLKYIDSNLVPALSDGGIITGSNDIIRKKNK